MPKMVDQYSEKIKGSFSFFDRMIINGYIRPLTADHSRAGALYQLGVPYKDYKSYFMNVTEKLKVRIEGLATLQGRPIQYLSSAKDCKEDVAKSLLADNPIDHGLICILKTTEICQSAKVYGSDEGKFVLKPYSTKCLHYYLYYQDKNYGFMFVKIQT